MKFLKHILLLIILVVAEFVSAQEEFSFQLYFEDAIGQRDTITLGYDPLATDTIDTAFGEVNILNQPWSDSTLDVRIGDKMYTGFPQPLAWTKENTYQAKRQILSSYCNNWLRRSEVVSIQFRAKNLPINVEWNANNIPDTCREFSSFFGTSADILSPPDAFNGLQLFNISHPNFYIDWYNSTSVNKELYFFKNLGNPKHAMEYFIENADTIGIFKFVFRGYIDLAQLQENLDNDSVEIFPNPTNNNDYVTIKKENNFESVLNIFKIDGTFIRKQTLLANSNVISISDLNAGVYLFKIHSDKGMITKKVIKN